MKFFICVVAVFAVVSAQKLPPLPPRYSGGPLGQDVVIVRTENENNGDGTFRWVSELSDGTRHEQSGYVKAGPDPENPIQVIQGSYTYFSPEGQQIDVSYIADENGFQPQGAHLPGLPQQAQTKFLENQRLRFEEEKRQRDETARYDEELRLYEQARRLGQYRPRPTPPSFGPARP